MGKVLAIGLDAASLPVMERLMADGRLPHLQRLQQESAYWHVDGGRAPLRNLQWSQFNFATALDRDCSTMFSFDTDSYRTVLRRARRELDGRKQFWDRSDVRTIVFDVPESAVVDSAVSVTAWGTHAPLHPRASNPPGLLDEIDRVVGVHPAFANDFDPAWHDARATDALADALELGARRRARAFLHLDQRFEWELAIVVMSEIHSAGHFWWHSLEPEHPLHHVPNVERARARLESVHVAVDAAVGEMVAAVPDDTTVVLFSHDDMTWGHGDVPTVALLPELLHRHHFGQALLTSLDGAQWKAAGCPPIVPAVGTVWREHIDSMLASPPRSLSSRVKQFGPYRRAKRSALGRSLIQALKGRPLGAAGVAIPPEERDGLFDEPERPHEEDTSDILFTAHYQPYWSQMRAFAIPTFNVGAVRLNLAGRERDGIVSPDDYETTCDEIERVIRACRDPRTGQPAVEDVERPRRDDPFDPGGDVADLVVVWRRHTLLDALEHPDLGVVGPVPTHRPGLHDNGGFLFIRDRGLEPGPRGERSALDIPPTLLTLAGATPDAGLEGRSVVPARDLTSR
jgi:predicted AlkP superfamily phosphohydrolase/phosphomutase